MQPFADSINPPTTSAETRATFHDPAPSPAQCASLLLDTLPRFMQALRLSIAGAENQALSIPQFRALHFIHLRSGANLSATAEFLGLTLPSTSKLVDILVRRKFLARQSDSADRRRMTLRLTPRGDALLAGAQDAVRKHLAGNLSRLGPCELFALKNALEIVQNCFPAPVWRMETQPCGNESSPPPPRPAAVAAKS